MIEMDASATVRRVARHEAGHVVASYLLGRPLGSCSIRPTGHYNGIFVGAPDPIRAEISHRIRFGPSLLQDQDLKRWAEAGIVVDLAGELAAEAEGYYRTGYGDDDPSPEVRAELRAYDPGPQEITSGEFERLKADDEQATPYPTDAENASDMARAVFGEQMSGAAVQWCREQARELVAWSVFRTLADALSEQLIQHVSLGIQQVRQILQEADPRIAVTDPPRRGAQSMRLTPEERSADLALMKAQDDLRWLHEQHVIDAQEYERRRAELGGKDRA